MNRKEGWAGVYFILWIAAILFTPYKVLRVYCLEFLFVPAVGIAIGACLCELLDTPPSSSPRKGENTPLIDPDLELGTGKAAASIRGDRGN